MKKIIIFFFHTKEKLKAIIILKRIKKGLKNKSRKFVLDYILDFFFVYLRADDLIIIKTGKLKSSIQFPSLFLLYEQIRLVYYSYK
jgi:hypothetical protein